MNRRTNPRYLVVAALTRLEEEEDFAAEILDSFLQEAELSELDRGLFTELFYGTVRMKKNLDFVLGLFSRRPLERIETPILNALRIGVYQILYLNRIPISASVNESVKIARFFGHQGTANFVNGILRNVDRRRDKIVYPDIKKDPVGHISAKYSFPEWMVKLWLNWWGKEETIAFCKASNEPPVTALRVNTLRTSVTEVAAHFREQGAVVQPGQFAPDVLEVRPGHMVVNDPWLQAGAYYIQDESSALVGHAVGPNPGELVYDLCSAPGGKTTHLAQLMENQGSILAFDNHPLRLKKVDENAERLGISIIQTQLGDSTEYYPHLPAADRVLVDAPCSGLGTLRHRPDIRWRKKPEEIDKLTSLQRQILRTAAQYVKLGGLLVYSTCTVTKQENQAVVEWFLKEHQCFSANPLPKWFPYNHSDPEYYRQIVPHYHGIDGFFVASMRKD